MDKRKIAKACESMYGPIDWACMLTGMSAFCWPTIVADSRPLTGDKVREANPEITAVEAEIFLQTVL